MIVNAHRTIRCLQAFFALLLVALIASPHVALAKPDRKLDQATQRQRTDTPRPKHTARPRPASCAEFGSGFIRMPGSDSCFRFNGGVGMGVGAVP